MQKIPTKEKIRMSLSGVIGVLSSPFYVGLSLIFGFLFGAIIYLIIEWGIYGTLLFSSLALGDKMMTVWLMLQQMGRTIFTTTDGILLLVVAVLQGVSLALIVFVIKRNRQNAMKGLGGSGLAAVAAALGLGCVPCGTSIILPIVTLFFSGSAYAAASVASMVVLGLAVLVTVYSLYRLGYVAFAYTSLAKPVAAKIKAKEIKNG